MSTLKVSSIQSNGTGFNDVVAFQNASGTENGTLCRAWVNFNGTGVVSIRQSFNVSSITDNGTGDYTVNFSNAMSDANYSVTGTAGQTTSAIGVLALFSNSGAANPSTTAVRIFTRNMANNPDDFPFDNVAIFR